MKMMDDALINHDDDMVIDDVYSDDLVCVSVSSNAHQHGNTHWRFVYASDSLGGWVVHGGSSKQ